jgi:hypothetical protein
MAMSPDLMTVGEILPVTEIKIKPQPLAAKPEQGADERELTLINFSRTIASSEKLKRPANIFNQNHFA